MTLEDAELLYAASDNIVEMAKSGALKELHERCELLKNTTDAQYTSI